MNVMRAFCTSCSGMGKYVIWKAVDLSNNIGTMESEEIVCGACNGKGYTEYATFSLEEANAILKHCGLTTES